MNLLLIDSEIPGLDIFMKSCNQNTKFVTYHTKLVTFQMLDKKIASFNISRYNYLGFVFVNDYNTGKLFVDDKPFITSNEFGIVDNYSTTFIKYLIRKYQIKTIDFLACNLLGEITWRQYFDFLAIQNNIKIRASDDLTGNLSSGGDWILESTGENVEKLYFNNNIKYWNYLLDIGSYSGSTCIITTDNSNNSYGCGFNLSGQLGLGNTTNRTTFQNIITNLSGKKIISITSGESHCLILTNDIINNLYSCGLNTYGQLGLGNLINTNTFQNVTTNISGKKIISISAGSNYSLILTNDATNNLYSCGYNNYGQLGLGDLINRNTFQNVTTNISGKKNNFISAGQNHSLILTNDSTNNLYSCGYNTYGQLGLGNNDTSYNTFQNVTINISGKKIILPSSGAMFSLILTNDTTNNLYSCGYDASGQLGLGDLIDRNTFQNVTTNISNKKIINASAGVTHSLILTNDSSNNLYGSGQNTYGQIGNGNNQSLFTTFQNTSTTILNKYFNGICAGLFYSIISTSEPTNNFYVMGDNTYGQLDLSNNTDINILTNTRLNISDKKVVFNNLMNSNTPTGSPYNPSFFNFNYGSNNATYYPTAQDNINNIISINNIANPESLFPTLIGTIGEAYSLSPLGTTFASTVTFDINCLYLSNVYYQYNINSELLLMGTNSSQLPYYSYNGNTVTVNTNILFAYIVLTVPPSNSGAQFSNLKKLILTATDNPVILPNTRLDCTFFNTPTTIAADINGWDVSSCTTMSSMFRDASFNNELSTWKPNKVTDMSYMFYGNDNFNKKISYDPTNGAWDVSAVTNMSYIFNEATAFNNSQRDLSGTEPMNWPLNPNVNLTNDISYSALTVANAQTLAPELLMYLNVAVTSTTESSTGSRNPYRVRFYNEDNTTIGTSTLTTNGTSNTILAGRYNIAGDSLWCVKMNCPTTASLLPGPNQGSISSDLSRNVIITGRWYNNYGPCYFYDSNDLSNSSLTLPWGGSPDASQNTFIVKYDTNGFSKWRARLCFATYISSHKINNTCCDISGNIYAAGRYTGQSLFQDSSLNTWVDISSVGLTLSSPQPDGFLAKYDANGKGIWFAKMTSNNFEMAHQTIVDRANDVYCAGYHDVSGTNIYNGAYNGFGTLSKTIPYVGTWFTKYDQNGTASWTADFSGNIWPSRLGYALSYDTYIGGYYSSSTPRLNNRDNSLFTVLTDISASNAYVAKYTSDGFGSWTSILTSNLAINTIDITGICHDKQFLDISYPQQGLKFAIYRGYFDGLTDKFGFFSTYYPYATGITSNLNGLSASTNGKYTTGEYVSICWWGFFRAKKTGTYTFSTTSDNASYLMINGNIVVNNGGTHGTLAKSGTCTLIAGTYYYIQIYYANLTGGQAFASSYQEPGGTAISNATGLATYFTDSSEYISYYDNWINQSSYTPNATMTLTNRNESFLNVNTTGSDPQLNLLNRPAINPYIYKYIHIKYKIISGNPDALMIYYGNNTYPFSESRKLTYTYPTPISDILGCWQNAVIDVTNITNWYTDNWTNWRLDPLINGTANIQFEYFFITDSPEYPLNEIGNNIYVTAISSGNYTSIYNSSFFYNTTGSGFSGVSNSFFKQYYSNNTFIQSYIVKYDLNGRCLWSILLDGDLNTRTSIIRTDKTGNVYVFGHFGSAINIRDKNGTICTTYTSSQLYRYDTFIAVYSSSGNYLWSARQQSSENDYIVSYGSTLTTTTNSYFGPSMAMS